MVTPSLHPTLLTKRNRSRDAHETPTSCVSTPNVYEREAIITPVVHFGTVGVMMCFQVRRLSNSLLRQTSLRKNFRILCKILPSRRKSPHLGPFSTEYYNLSRVPQTSESSKLVCTPFFFHFSEEIWNLII